MAYDNVSPRFLPPMEHRPLLTFGVPRLHYAWSHARLNAAVELLDKSLSRVGPDHIAYLHVGSDGGVDQWTYGRLAAAVNRFAAGLRELGVEPGSRVLTRFSDVPWAAVAQLAIWRIGAIVVPSASVEASRELTFMLQDTEAACVVCETGAGVELEVALRDCPTVKTVIGWPEPIGSYGHSIATVSAGQPDACDPYPTAPLDASGIYYTGGTTGRPKGCIHTHAAEVALADLNGETRGLTPRSVLLCHAPVGHAFGNGEKINFPLRAGAAAVWASRPTPQRMWELAAEHGVTTLAGAATMYRMMLRDCPVPQAVFGDLSLETALSSGEILDSHTYGAWEQALGFPLRNTVGMTPMRHLFIDPMFSGTKVAPGLAVGAPLPGYEARLVDEDGNTVAEQDAPGRLAIRGPSGVAYWINQNPVLVERAAQDVRGGWSLLDDAYTRDADGWLWFHGRLDDMIVTGGRQVAPIEVEEVLGGHPAVAEVAVVSAPDEVRGQIVAACVCVAPGHQAGPDLVIELQEFAKKAMAGYKYPRRIEFMECLPKDGVGKLQRRLLRERFKTLVIDGGRPAE